MKSLRNRMLAIAALALAAVCVSAVPVSAQPAYKGSFTLTHEVQWQSAKLPAGSYTFEIQSVSLPATMTLKGPNGYQFVTALVVNQEAGEQSMLIVENHGRSSAVRELRLAAIGRSLRYAVPKAPKDVEIAQGPVTTEQILVAMNVK